ncbi:galactose mutarotase [Desemzia sp. RIT804]|uniref:aldose epimerase family protein n=1 Tax=Desemzia sp. RIT 804 TaxID=2810209 RepID=UPI001951A99E|nr:aldose epimerase family protein [Desemzia sp. RIT 804]MBM6615489.1 galactose mutarotase [Desemzia sp. RIT 804]
MDARKRHYGWYEGKEVFEYVLTNDQQAVFRCIDYGAVVTGIEVPDQFGKRENVVLGFKQFEDYVNDSPYFGAFVGRVAGRIADGAWSAYRLTQNEGQHHIHGGVHNFSQRVWDSRVVKENNKVGVAFSLVSPDGDNGYPGNLSVTVTYYWTNENVWEMLITAETDQQTLFNPTNHTYFNLSGNTKRKVLNHTLQMDAEKYAETNGAKLPTGRLLPVANTAFDFRVPKKMRTAIKERPEGFDTPFKLTGNKKIQLHDPDSGRILVIETDREAVVVFSTTDMEEDYLVDGEKMSSHRGIALETQELPDAVHHPKFRSIVIEPERTYHYRTKYTFTTHQA